MRLPAVLSGRRRQRFGYLVANGISQAGVAVATALLVKNGFDRLIAPQAPLLLREAVLFAAGLSLAIAIGAWLRWRGHLDAEHMGQGYVHALRLRLFRHLARIGAEGARQMSRGAIVLRFVGDLTALRQWISYGLARLTVSGLATVLAIAVLAAVEPVVALAVGIAVTVAAGLALAVGPHLRATTRESRRRRGRLAAQLNDRVANIGVVEAFGQEAKEKRRFDRLSSRLRRALIARARIIGLLRALSEASASFAGACALFAGALQVGLGLASPGAVVAAMVVAGLLAPRLQDLGRVYEYWNGALVAREKLEKMLALRPVGRSSNRGAEQALEPGPGRIELCGLRLEGLFHGLEATIEPGERVAIVGANGAGKSTLLRLIAGILDPLEGRVRLDGQDIRKCRWEEVRRAFAMVSPDLPLLRGSLRLNLTYGAAAWTAEDLERVMAALGLEALVARLPAGIESRISENGGGLSTGERARIALARAILSKPRVLLLDEADANLDDAARDALETVVEGFTGTVLFITHDPAQAVAADRILKVENGRLHEIAPAEWLPRNAAPQALRAVV
ncbi:MAG: ABC transporter ATP-binding protein [Kiloniellales bacterium]|nr:ABC transporter ATP-binding protein [Kiloniellales bacterium]